MRDVRSSKPDAVKLSNFHIVITSLAAVAGVAIAGYQAFAPQPAARQPVNVVLSLDQQNADMAAADETVAKSDAPALMTETVNLAQDASFTAALKDGSENRYNFASLFDGESDTFLAIEAPDLPVQVALGTPIDLSTPVEIQYSDGIYRPAPDGTTYRVQFAASGPRAALRWRTVVRGKVADGKITTRIKPRATGYWRITVAGTPSAATLVRVR